MQKIVHHVVMKDGQARIKDKEHVKAEMVARMYIGTDYSIEDVMEQYNLTAAEVHAAIAYYYDNQAALDTAHEAIISEIQENAMTLEKFKAKLAARQSDKSTD
jgi:uncharacterized protein (DUF433 family)